MPASESPAPRIVAIHASPRRQGNTSTLLDQAVAGARDKGAIVDEVVLRWLKISPCLELYGCKQESRCTIQYDFQAVYDLMLNSQCLMLASPLTAARACGSRSTGSTRHPSAPRPCPTPSPSTTSWPPTPRTARRIPCR